MVRPGARTNGWSPGPGPAGLAVGIGAAVTVAVIAVVAPLTVMIGAGRLAALAIAVTGLTYGVRRLGVVDLGGGAMVGAGAALGAVATGLAGLPVGWILPAAAVGGGLVGALSYGTVGRTGRTRGALTSLAIGVATVAVLGSWRAAGGRAGYHAVPLLTGTDEGDLVVVAALLAAVVAVVWLLDRRPVTDRARVAAAAPEASAAMGRHPVVDLAAAGAVAGAIAGLGGASLAVTSGSVVPAAYGLGLAAALALAALVGGRWAAGGVVGAAAIWGPGILFPLAPAIGDAPPLLVLGPLGLALLTIRPAGLGPARSADAGAPDPGTQPLPSEDGPPAPLRERQLVARGLSLPRGVELDLEVAPGEILAVIGPNGAGKSTLLARLGGQLPDHGRVRIDDERAPTGAVHRARTGVARTWQHPPTVDQGAALAVATNGPEGAAAAAWARSVLGAQADDPAGAQLVRAAAQRPAIVLLDEPAAEVDADAVAALLHGWRSAGVAVLAVDHRPEIAAIADRIIRLERPDGRS